MRSALYEGVLTHRRHHPSHDFSLRLAMPLLDLDEIDQVVAHHPLWSRERRNVASVRRRDFLGDPATGLADAVRDTVEGATGVRPAGPISVLAHVRTLGWVFNPIAVYYCYDPTGARVEHAVAHVTNTPWKERHAYVLGPAGTHVVRKALHVSPFFGMDQSYRIAYGEPDDRLHVGITVLEEDAPVFTAGLTLRRHAVDRANLGRLLWRYPMLTMRVSAAIHTNALRLWRKGATYHPHPPTVPSENTDDRPPSCPDRPVEAA